MAMGNVYLSTSRSLQRALGYASTEFDRLFRQQRTTLDLAERKRLAATMQQIVARTS